MKPQTASVVLFLLLQISLPAPKQQGCVCVCVCGNYVVGDACPRRTRVIWPGMPSPMPSARMHIIEYDPGSGSQPSVLAYSELALALPDLKID